MAAGQGSPQPGDATGSWGANPDGVDPERRIVELRWMQSEAARPDGARRLVRCVARGVGGHAALLDPSDRLVHAFPEVGAGVLTAAAADIDSIRAGSEPSGALDPHGRAVSTLQVGPDRDGPLLVVVAEHPRFDELLIDATRLLWLCWQVEEARRNRQRVEDADSQARESVLHLLMVGDLGGAKRVAATLGPGLPHPARVIVVESRAGVRDVVSARLDEATRGQAWIVRCPVYTGHIIVIAMASRDRDKIADPVEERIRELALRRGDICVGASGVVALRDVPAGYEQAFHALATARSSSERYALFDPKEELTVLLAPAGRSWAQKLLAPLLEYVPERPQDPDADELLVTLGSWLSFHHRAARQLKIHRNTLAARIAHLRRLLGCDPRDLEAQAVLQLALRLLDQPETDSAGPEPTLDVLFDTAAVRLWAHRQLSPLFEEGAEELLSTLRAWLACCGRMDETAAALNISGPGARKRLLRIEKTLGRSLLHGPSARYALYFALRVHDEVGLPPLLLTRSGTGRD